MQCDAGVGFDNKPKFIRPQTNRREPVDGEEEEDIAIATTSFTPIFDDPDSNQVDGWIWDAK